MISGSGNMSLRKVDLENQRIPAVGFQKTVFAHKATAGQSSINLTSLTLPPEMSANGFTNPSTATLQAANLLFYRKNLILTSSLRGRLVDQLSYSVATSTSISFLGFTAAEGEIFTGQIDYVATGSARVVGASITPASGTIAIGTTDFNTGTPFKVGQNSSSQVGAVLFFVDGVLQTRNTGNSSTTLDGNYYEVDAGGGLGVILRLNQAATQTLNVLVISNGILYERPDGSMLATIENVNGQLQNMAAYVAAATGQTPTTVLGAAPSNVDLKAFGDRVFALEQTKPTTATTTSRGLSYIPGSMVRLDSPNGYGSTNTGIRRYTNVTSTLGSDITYADSATLGASLTINAAGVYAISRWDGGGTVGQMGLSLNTSSPTSNVANLSASERIALANLTGASSTTTTFVSATIVCAQGDVIRPHDLGAGEFTNTGSSNQLIITQVAKF